MEDKPIVTFHGDKALFDKLRTLLWRGLPREPVEWRRSYGRAPKKVTLEAHFVPFSVEALPRNIGKALIGIPFFHTYWTDCDIDNYKSFVKDDINHWLSSLKTQGLHDWLIIWINNEPLIKSKLLPRTSVIDKIKNDFCGKVPDRYIVLVEPFKNDSRSSESWSHMLVRIRQLILQAYNRNMSKYEETMRGQRERRNQQGWNFCHYFMLQEELAFVHEMLGLYDEALVQYDELDALFTQFILNHSLGETTPWLSNFCDAGSRWEGLDLSKHIDQNLRTKIEEGQASLIDFRSYLFTRQSSLLVLLKRPCELAQRSIPFLHNCVQELNIMEVPMPPGSINCWVFVNCLEILNTCEKYSDSSHSLFTASLWEYAWNKLHSLGELCGLMPGIETTSEQLHTVVNLISGMGDSHLHVQYSNIKMSPMAKLREALSSAVTFKKHYFEMSELAMGTFKHIGRIRSARLIGKTLATFYMKMGEFQKAESYLSDALKTYKQEGWEELADRTRIDLAECQKQNKHTHKYLKSCVHLAISSNLPLDFKVQYFEDFIRMSKEPRDSHLVLKATPSFTIESISMEAATIVLGAMARIHLKLHSTFPQAVLSNEISFSLHYASHNGLSDSGGLIKKRSLMRNASSASNASNSSTCSITSADIHIPQSPPVNKNDTLLDLQSTYSVTSDKQQMSSTLVCRNSHLLLRRIDSGSSYVYREKEVIKDDFTFSASVADIELLPGGNEVVLTSKVDSRGSYYLSQLCITVGIADFIKSKAAPSMMFDVVCEEPSLEIETSNKTEVMLGGVYHDIKVILQVGTKPITNEAKLRVIASDGLLVDLPREEESLAEANSDDVYHVLTLADDEDTQLNAGQTVTVVIPIMAQLLHYASVLMERELSVECSWDSSIMTTQMFTFHNPFKIVHKIHTAAKKKFIQVLVSSNSKVRFELCEPQVCSDCPDVEMKLLNKRGQILMVSEEQSASYMWQINLNTNNIEQPLKCNFQFEYKSLVIQQQQAKSACSYDFTLENYKTLLISKSEVHCANGGKSSICTVASVCQMSVHIKNISDRAITQLHYQVNPAQKYWHFPGCNQGMVQLTNNAATLTLECVPLTDGFLPHPAIKFMKVTEKESENEVIEMKEPFYDGELYNSSRSLQVTVKKAPLKSFSIQSIQEGN